MKKLSAIAEVYNAQMAPHLYAGPIEWAANVHLAASIPNLYGGNYRNTVS